MKKEPKTKSKLPIYKDLTIEEQDLLFAQYEKWNGRILQMVLDKDSLYKSRPQLTYYAQKYNFKSKLVQNRTEIAKEVREKLQDSKMRAVEQAMRILESRNVFVYTRFGTQVFDKDGNPLIIEQLPYYKEIKAAWEIIKTELGEPTTIAKNNLGFEDAPISEVVLNIVNAPRTDKKTN